MYRRVHNTYFVYVSDSFTSYSFGKNIFSSAEFKLRILLILLACLCCVGAGQPRHHLLTTGWSAFVNKKKLISGDAVLFLRCSIVYEELGPFSF